MTADLAGLLGLDDGGGDWREQALCAQTDPDAFFPEKGGSALPAKSICNGRPGREPCPVRAECLEYALGNEIRFGIFGGLSERERRRVAADRRRAAGGSAARCGTLSGYTRHRRAGEKPCGPCRQANADHCRDRRRAGAA